jgi:ABC-type multidrug transport system fused ATPase/permease subunit
MWDALDLANAGDFVRLAESTLDTEVGDKGSSFSGGQKQRIALAMALVRKPDILVLDEVTSSLDYESEKAIVDTLNKIKNKMTIISITHKISVAQNADLVYLFNNGRVIESGHISELSESAKLIYE